MSDLMPLDEFNGSMMDIHVSNITYPKKTGIACPECGLELLDLDASILCSNPPKRNVVCSNQDCGWRGYRLA